MTKINIKNLRELIGQAMLTESHSYLLEQPDLLSEVSIFKNKFPFKALFMFGPAGAGKGYVLKNVFKLPTGKGGFETVNPDVAIEEVFPLFGISTEFANSKEGGDAELEQLQQKSREILQNASRAHEANLIAIANALIFDTTGEKVPKMVGRIKSLAQIGYDVAVMMINVPTEASVERDVARGPSAGKTGRTVGKTRTTGISQSYQKAVVQHRGYFEALASTPNVTMLADDVFNNIFDLETGELLTKPTVVTPEMLPDDLNPEKNPEAFAKEKEKMKTAAGRLQKWLDTPVENENGKMILAAMKRLVKHPSLGEKAGRLGQNMNDLVIAMANPELASDPILVKAAKHLSALGGVAMGTKSKKGGGVEMGRGESEDSPYVQDAIRGKKKTGDQSVRQMTGKKGKQWKPGEGGKTKRQEYEPGAGKGMFKESMEWGDLLDMIREELTDGA